MGYLITGIKEECNGCGACVQVCSKKAIKMAYDNEKFAYPTIDPTLCVECGACTRVCPMAYTTSSEEANIAEFKPIGVFGGYHLSEDVLRRSTSGGAFTAICQVWAEEGNFAIYGASSEGLDVAHIRIDTLDDLPKICKSKYRQSDIGMTFQQAKKDLRDGIRVLFSGTPCQIDGLLHFLGSTDTSNLLTVEVICEGVPSPLFVEKYAAHLGRIKKDEVISIDYRSKGKATAPFGSPMKWDFERMQASFRSRSPHYRDRWFNPFWKIWLSHLMSRPSCYNCRYANPKRNADITLGDLWGVHLYCPELYNNNHGASLIISNTRYGDQILEKAKKHLCGHNLNPKDAIRYQGPLRRPVMRNPEREAFMADLTNPELQYSDIVKKWYEGPSIKLLFSKYIWGNRNKVGFWKLCKCLGIKYKIK